MPRVPPSQRKHGHSFVNGKATPEYNAWSSMKSRCLCPTAPNYKDYGARGIAICSEWVNSFEQFLSDMGPKPSPGHSLDRIDNDGPYSPENCRWADRWAQASNRRNNHIVEYQGQRLTVTQAAALAGKDITLVRSRMKRGWPIERALS